MGATITYLMLPEDPRHKEGIEGTLYFASMTALDGYVGRHMMGMETDEYLKENYDPDNPPEPVEPQIWRMTVDQAVYELKLRDRPMVPQTLSLESLCAAFNETAQYVDEVYTVEDDLIVGSSPCNPEWKFNSFDVGGRFAVWFTDIAPDQWPSEEVPCSNCNGQGSIPPKSFLLPRALRLTSAGRSAPDTPTECARCRGKGHFVTLEPPPEPDSEDLAFAPDRLLKILDYGTEASEPQSFVDLRGTWQYLPLKREQDGDGREYVETDLTLFREALLSAPPGTVVVPIEHDGG